MPHGSRAHIVLPYADTHAAVAPHPSVSPKTQPEPAGGGGRGKKKKKRNRILEWNGTRTGGGNGSQFQSPHAMQASLAHAPGPGGTRERHWGRNAFVMLRGMAGGRAGGGRPPPPPRRARAGPWLLAARHYCARSRAYCVTAPRLGWVVSY
jgi:hypothetical protein